MASPDNSTFQLRGVTASPGKGLGPVVVLPPVQEFLPERAAASFEEERTELHAAIEATLEELRAFEETQPDAVKEMLHLQQAFLRDPQLLDVVDELLHDHMNAPRALYTAMQRLRKLFFDSANDFYRQRWIDFEDAGRSVLDRLLGVSYEARCLELARSTPERPVLVAEDLAPALYLKLRKPAGIVLHGGGPAGHLALLAANQGIPILVRVEPASDFERIQAGQWIELHGEGNVCTVYSNRPDHATVSTGMGAHAVGTRWPCEVDLPGGKQVGVSLNADDADTIRSHGEHFRVCVGLFRSEFLYLRDPGLLTDEDRAAAAYADILSAVGGDGSLTIRLLDVDEDKFSTHFFTRPGHRGLRGADYFRAESDIFRGQIRAIYRACLLVKELPVLRLMAPMIRTPEDWQFVREALEEERRLLIPRIHVDYGMMLEIPSAVFSAVLLEDAVDFFSLGTNDLLRYFIGKSRTLPAPDDLYEPSLYHSLFHAFRHIRKEVSICGMLASRPEFVPLFVDLGIRTFSVPLGSYEAIRQALAKYDPQARVLRRILRLRTRQQIRDALG